MIYNSIPINHSGDLLGSKLLKKIFAESKIEDSDQLPTLDQWQAFLKTVDQSYEDLEANLHRSRHALSVATEEMHQLHKDFEAQSNQTIKSLDSKLQNIMSIAPCIIMWLDKKGFVEGCNDNFKQLIFSDVDFEKNKVTCLNLGFKELHENIVEFISSPLVEISVLIPFDISIKIFHYKVTLNKLKDQDRISVIGFDLTEVISKQNTINEIQTKSLQTSRMAVLGEMAAGVAHEINNPLMILNSILFIIQKLILSKKYEQIPEKLDKIQNTISRIGRIVQGLRMFARDGTNDPMVPTDITLVIKESLELCSENLKYKNVKIAFEKNSSEDIIVDGRATQISQVVLNLISNAKDAVENLPEKWIKIELEKSDHQVLIKIIDSGKGLPTEVRDRLFQPFFTTKEHGQGTGLGLSISSGIIQNHNGSIYLDSKNPNTCFVISLPLAS